MNDIKSYCFPNSSESGNAPRTEIWVKKKKKNSRQALKNESDDKDNSNGNSKTMNDYLKRKIRNFFNDVVKTVFKIT